MLRVEVASSVDNDCVLLVDSVVKDWTRRAGPVIHEAARVTRDLVGCRIMPSKMSSAT